nr:MAG TPA: hypothetical protein [Caudoviricetes sp.]
MTFPKKSAILYTQDEERKQTHPFLPSSSNMRRQTQQTDGVVLTAHSYGPTRPQPGGEHRRQGEKHYDY